MVFTVQDLHDLIVLLEERPEWQAEMRRVLLTQEILNLPQVVQGLANQVQEMAAIQRQSIEAQKQFEARAEARFARLEKALAELAEAQKRTELVLSRLTGRMERVERRLEQLSNRLGLDLEVDAEEVLLTLFRERGIRVLVQPFALEVNSEIDVVVFVEQPTGERLWVVVEVKGRLRRKELGKFLRRLESSRFQAQLQKAGVTKPYLPYAFGLRVYAEVDRMAEEAGVGILTFRGERVAPRLWE